MEKYGTDRQATDANMAHAPCMVDNYGYKHTLRMRLKVTLRCTLPVLYRYKRKQYYCLHFNIIQSLEFAQTLGIALLIGPAQCPFPFAFTRRRS